MSEHKTQGLYILPYIQQEKVFYYLSPLFVNGPVSWTKRESRPSGLIYV